MERPGLAPPMPSLDDTDAAASSPSTQLTALHAFVAAHPRLLVVTGAGISTASGIPGYRDADGNWQGRKPIQLKEFLESPALRQRYWARSMAGWPVVSRALPNDAHRAIARLQQAGKIEALVTQNVDGLHQRAGSGGVIELHGNIGTATCLDCGLRHPRASIQHALERSNPAFRDLSAAPAADGDAQLERSDFHVFAIPDCVRCGGMLKPDVVFFGESVPRERVAATLHALDRADALLVVGSSLMVYSGYRFCVAAQKSGKPVAAINLGHTRADSLLTLKARLDCAEALCSLAA